MVHSLGALAEADSGKMIRKLIAPVESSGNSFELSTKIFSFHILFVLM